MNELLIPYDKALHIIYGALIACVAQFFVAPLLALALVAAVAAAKEVRDYVTKKGTPDPWDFVATVAGGALVLLRSLL